MQKEREIRFPMFRFGARLAKGDRATIRAVIESRGYDNERAIVSIRPANRPDQNRLLRCRSR
nr:hypothetical protein [Rhodopirellula sp. SM50]